NPKSEIRNHSKPPHVGSYRPKASSPWIHEYSGPLLCLKKLLNLLHHFDKALHFRLCVVKVETGAGRGFDTQSAHQRLRAVMSTSECDPPLVRHCDDVMGVNILQ